jgi:predicted O-methyltransferase YrrM
VALAITSQVFQNFGYRIWNLRMNPELKTLLNTLEQFGWENDQRETDRQRKMEIGTSNGYSTLWFADAVCSIPSARITSIERNPSKIEMARQNLRRAGLEDFVLLLEGEASDIVKTLPGPFDCVLFDADRTSAPAQLRILLPKLLPDVLLLFDNVLSHPSEVAGYLAAAEQLLDFSSVVVPVGKGLHMAFRDGRT